MIIHCYQCPARFETAEARRIHVRQIHAQPWDAGVMGTSKSLFFGLPLVENNELLDDMYAPEKE